MGNAVIVGELFNEIRSRFDFLTKSSLRGDASGDVLRRYLCLTLYVN